MSVHTPLGREVVDELTSARSNRLHSLHRSGHKGKSCVPGAAGAWNSDTAFLAQGQGRGGGRCTYEGCRQHEYNSPPSSVGRAQGS